MPRRILDVAQDDLRALAVGFALEPDLRLHDMIDGKLAREELSSFLQPRFAEFDLNKDGVLDRDEIQKLVEQMANRKRP